VFGHLLLGLVDLAAGVIALMLSANPALTYSDTFSIITRTAYFAPNWGSRPNNVYGWGLVQAICDFVHQRIAFGYEHARVTRSASEAYEERRGVCRDYAHLAVAFCRALNIPARYCTGYLGDVGTPPPYPPGDFAAWFEAYLGGQWHTFDPRNNVPRIGRVLLARGRDAADVAITTTFGPNTLNSFRVWTDEICGAVAPEAPGVATTIHP
jgi:transglutaminase-like putative cysteine protease